MVPLYTSVISSISKLSPSPHVLFITSSILASVFHDPPPPFLGPLAFKEFWQTHYMNLNLLQTEIPEVLWPILRAFMVAEGDGFAPGLSYGSNLVRLLIDQYVRLPC